MIPTQVKLIFDLLNQNYAFVAMGEVKDNKRIYGRLYPEEVSAGQTPPTIPLEEKDVQGIMDTLWKAGIRPTGVNSNESELTAIKYHLEDMRKLVFESSKLQIGWDDFSRLDKEKAKEIFKNLP